jgi:hypothetical protein
MFDILESLEISQNMIWGEKMEQKTKKMSRPECQLSAASTSISSTVK